MLERFRRPAFLLVIALGVPLPAHAQKAWQLWQSLIRRHSFEETRIAAQAAEAALRVSIAGMSQLVPGDANCRMSVMRWHGATPTGKPADVHVVDAGDLLARTRTEMTAQGVAQLWVYAANKGGVIRYAGTAPKQHVDSFPILLGATSDTAKVAERARVFQALLTACEWRF